MTQAHLIFDFEPGKDENPAEDFDDGDGVPPRAGSAASPLDLLLRQRGSNPRSGRPEEEEWDVRLMHLIASRPHSPASDERALRPRAL
jgi:hypothetical protein